MSRRCRSGTSGLAGQARTRHSAVALAVALAGLLALSGCTAHTPAASASPNAGKPSSASPGSATPTVAPRASAAPVLHPDGSATDNLPLFTAVVDQVWASEHRDSVLAYVDALSTAGFSRTDMQTTADTTTVGNPAESFQFSVRWGASECLVGQVGPSTGDPVAVVLPQLAGGRCLVGKTPPVGG